jgi:1,2-diacylglycerol 3-alpha-glucosyltransferase
VNVGIVTTWFERGAAYVSRQYMELFEAQGVKTFIYARGGERQARVDPNWERPNVTWAKPSFVPGAGTLDRKDFLAWIRKNGITVVLFNEQHWMPAVLWARDAGVLTLAYIDYYTEKTIPFHAAYDGLVCNTRRHFSAFEWHPQCTFVPWGTDLEVFRPTGACAPVQGDGRCVFFHSAGMSPYRKGTDLVIEAFARMQERTRARLVIHTQVDLARDFPGLAGKVADLERQGRLSVIHREVTAPGLYHLGDVYVYPSRLEGVGLTQAEALACGLPIITPDNPPMSEFVALESGIVVPVAKFWSRFDAYYWPMCEADIGALAAAMDRYAVEPDIGERKRKARQYAQEYLDWSCNGGSLVEWVRQLKRREIAPELRAQLLASFPPNSMWYWVRGQLKVWLGL